MKIFLRLLSWTNASFALAMIANLIACLIEPEWVFMWKVPPESMFDLFFLTFMFFMWGELFFLIVFRLTAPYALDQADQLLKGGDRDKAMGLYFTLVKSFNWPRVYRARIPEMIELTIGWLIEKKDDRLALKIAERAKNSKVNLSSDLQKRIDQLKDKPEMEYKEKILKSLTKVSEKEKVEIAIKLLKDSIPIIRGKAASEIARVGIRAVGVWYELANRLADASGDVRLKAAEAFWKLEGVDYAIRSLRDEYLNPAHMTNQEVFRGIYALLVTSQNRHAFKDILSSNWKSFPRYQLEILRISWAKDEIEASKIIKYLAKATDPRIRAAICSEAFRLNLQSAAVWDQVAILLADGDDNVCRLTARRYWKGDEEYKPNQKDPRLRFTPVKLAIGILERLYEYGRLTKQQAIKGLFSLIDNAPNFSYFDDTFGSKLIDPLGGSYLDSSSKIFKWEEVLAELEKRKYGFSPRLKATEKISEPSKCDICGTIFYRPKNMIEKTKFKAMQRVRVGCSKCRKAVCFDCAVNAADKKGKSGECFCPECGADLGRGGEAGQLGDHYDGWDR